MKMSQLKKSGETVYTWAPALDGSEPAIHIAIDRLRKLLEATTQPIPIAITEQFIELAAKGHMGIEWDHANSLPEAALEAPGLMIDWEVGTHTLADDAHRMIRRFARGDKFMLCYIAPKRVWSRFVIEDFPSEPRPGHWKDFILNSKVRLPGGGWVPTLWSEKK